MEIHGLNRLTLLDYPGKVACTIFTGHCNLRCPFCHNSSLVLDPSSQPTISEDEIFDFLESRRGKLEGVCITGGEPLMNPDIEDFLRRVKGMGYSIKLDTNGTFPLALQTLVKDHVVDYVAMDIKSSPENYHLATGKEGATHVCFAMHSVNILMSSMVDYEFRTTAVKSLHTMDDFRQIGKWLKGCRRYRIQTFEDHGTTIAPNLEAFTPEEERAIADIMREYIDDVEIRGI